MREVREGERERGNVLRETEGEISFLFSLLLNIDTHTLYLNSLPLPSSLLSMSALPKHSKSSLQFVPPAEIACTIANVP